MKKREDIFNFQTLDFYKKEGYFDEFSEEHFLMKILNNSADLPERFQEEIFQYCIKEEDRVRFDNLSFMFSFSARICNMFNLFDKSAIEKFLKRQLPSGKENYDEMTFFQALSEIECINYVANMVPDSKKIECEYEPQTNGKCNPEARIASTSKLTDFVYDIEVKNPKFGIKEINQGERYIKINIPFAEENLDIIEGMAGVCNYNVIYPNFNKVKDYIVNVNEKKFVIPQDSKHKNILFMNWSFISPKSSGITEPCTLLYDERVGILKTKVLHKYLGITENELTKISAIVVYCDNYDSIISVNLLTSVQLGNCKIMINDIFGNNVDKASILEELRIPEVIQNDCAYFTLWTNTQSGKEKDLQDKYVMDKACGCVLDKIKNGII